MSTPYYNSNNPFSCFGNLVADSSNNSGMGGSLLITNSSNGNTINTGASLAFIVAGIYDISGTTYSGGDGNTYGNSKSMDFINNGGFNSLGQDVADVRINAVIDTATGTTPVGTACVFKVSPDSTNPPNEAMRIASSGNVGIGTQNPTSTLDIVGNVNIYNPSGAGVIKLQGNTLNNIGIGNTTLTNITAGSSNTGFGLGTLASVTTGQSNTAVGHNALQYATLGGSNNTAVGFGALANNNANNNNTALGYNAFNTNPGNYTQSTAIGYNAQPSASNQIMLGTPTETVVTAGDAVVGGSLSVTSNLTTSGLITANGGLTVASGQILTSSGTTTLTGATTAAGLITANGGLQVNGTIVATGQITGLSFNATSDYRMKNNIQPLMETKSIDVLNPVEYDLVGGSHDMGFLAHEVQEFFPFLVTGVKDGPKMQSLNYNGLFALLVKEIKDIKKRLVDTEETIKQLTNK